MKMLKKYAYLLTMAAMAFGFAACSEGGADYEPAQPVSPDCQEVYFPSSNPTTLDLSSIEAQTAVFEIVVARNYAYAAASIPVKVVSVDMLADGETPAFEIPETIEFADGALKTTLNVSVNGPLADGVYGFNIAFEGEEYLHPYKMFDGGVAYGLKVSVENWENLGMATLRDDYITGAFNAPNSVWQCECWTRSTMPGYICLKNAWTSTYPLNEPGQYQEEDHWFYVNISNPAEVVIPDQYLGFDWGYGEFCIFTKKPGTLVDGVITFPVNGLAIGMRDYTSGKAGWYCNASGLFAIALPGYEIPQPEEPEVPGVDPDAEPANIVAMLFTFSDVLPSYSAQYPDHTSLAGIVMGEDIVAGGYALLKGDLGAAEMVKGSAVKAVVDQLCQANGISEDQLFQAFGDDYFADINSEYGCALAFGNLNPATAYTLLVKGLNSKGGIQYTAHTLATTAAPSAVPATGSYVRKGELQLVKNLEVVKMIR